MGAKAKGSRRERNCRDILIKQFYLVQKAGGSLGVFDIWAVLRQDAPKMAEMPLFRAIQVKSSVWCSPKERQAIETCPLPLIVSKEIWRKDDYKKWRIRTYTLEGKWREEILK